MTFDMTRFATIVSHTPLWVWVVLALLLWRGLQQLKPQDISPRKLLMTPAVFIVLGLLGFGSRSLEADLCWAAAALPAVMLGVSSAPRGVVPGAVPGTIRRPGSIVPLIRSMVVFIAQYVTAVMAATSPGAPLPHFVAAAVSGLSFGFFAGYAVTSWLRVRPFLASSAMGAAP